MAVTLVTAALTVLAAQASMMQPKRGSIVQHMLPLQQQHHHGDLNLSTTMAGPRRRLQNKDIAVNFANVYPDNYAVCFNYGPQINNLNRWAGPVRYGKSTLVSLDGDDYNDFLYTDVYSVSSSASSCSSRTSLHPGTWYDTLSENHVNIWFWAVDAESQSGTGAAHNFVHWEPDVDLEVYLNMAVGYSSCTFKSEFRDGSRAVQAEGLGYSYQTLYTAGISCNEFYSISKIHVECDGETASIDINIEDICPDVSHAFVAYGRKYYSSYPLSLMLLQGTSCSRVESCDEVVQGGHIASDNDEKSKKSEATKTVTIAIIVIILFVVIVFVNVVIALRMGAAAGSQTAMTNVPSAPSGTEAVAVELHPMSASYDDKVNQMRPPASSSR